MLRTRCILPYSVILLTAISACDTPVATEAEAGKGALVVHDPFSAPVLLELREGDVPPRLTVPAAQGPSRSVATATVPGVAVTLFYPTPGQPVHGACWMGVRVAGNGDVFPTNGHIWRVSPNGVLLNAFEYGNLWATNSSNHYFELDEPNAKMYAAFGGLRTAPFVQGSAFTTAIGGLSSQSGAIVLGRGPLNGSLLVNEPNRIGRVTLSPLSVSTFTAITTGGAAEGLASAPDGALYAARGTVPAKLLKISTSGEVTQFATGPAGSYRRMVAVSENGNVFWGGNGGIDMYAPDGTLIGSLPGPPNKAAYEGPFGSAFDSEGNLYVLDNWGCREIYKFAFSDENLAPVVSLGPVSGSEGSPVTFSAAVTDPEGDALTYSWDFGDGESATTGAPVSHTYTNNRPFLPAANPPRYQAYDVSLTVEDAAGNVTTVQTTATIANVDPVVSAGPDASFLLGGTYDLNAVYSDPGDEPGGWEYVVDWGDGTSTGSITAPAPGSSIVEAHVYASAGCYDVRVTVREKLELTDGGFDEAEVCVILPVPVDLRQGGDVATIRMNANGNANIAVILPGTADFNAAAIDVSSVTLGDGNGTDTHVSLKNNGTFHAALNDADGDGDMDLTLHFTIAALMANGDVTGSTTQLCINGRLADGTPFRGCDAVRVLP